MVLYVLGNHEFYGHHWDRLIGEARLATQGSNVQLLERDRVEIAGVQFLRATLWTDFELYGPERRSESVIAGRDALADFTHIEGVDGYALQPQATIDRHAESVVWLKQQMDGAVQPTVVITHHSPSLANEHPRFVGSDLGPCFHSNLEGLFQPPVRLWISGHTHYSSQTKINSIPLVSNQRGYPREDVPFQWDALMEIDGSAL